MMGCLIEHTLLSILEQFDSLQKNCFWFYNDIEIDRIWENFYRKMRLFKNVNLVLKHKCKYWTTTIQKHLNLQLLLVCFEKTEVLFSHAIWIIPHWPILGVVKCTVGIWNPDNSGFTYFRWSKRFCSWSRFQMRSEVQKLTSPIVYLYFSYK